MAFFPDEEDETRAAGKPFERVGFASEFDENDYFISYQEFYDRLCDAIEKGMAKHENAVKTALLDRLHAFRQKHNLHE